MMHTTLSRNAHARRREVELRDVRCCDEVDPCAVCQAEIDEIRAARRDALIHSLATVRPRGRW